MNNEEHKEADRDPSVEVGSGVGSSSGHPLAPPKEDEEDEEFVLVVRKGRTQRHKKGTFVHDISTRHASKGAFRPVSETRSEILRKVNTAVKQVRESKFYLKVQEVLDRGFEEVTGSASRPDKLELYCLGLGPFSSHLMARIARFQLAFLILMKEKFESTVELYDPVFHQQEKDILSEDLGLKVSEFNEEAKHRVSGPTIVYMPHCPHLLVNNLLSANWNEESLPNCFLISNSISQTLSVTPISYVDKCLSFFHNVQKICVEIPIKNIFEDYSDVFNDISLHVFPPSKLLSVSETFWIDVIPPVYSLPHHGLEKDKPK